METRTSGAEGGPGKRAGRDLGTAPRSDPYIIGAAGQSAAATLVERTSRFTIIVGLPEGKQAGPLADVLTGTVHAIPDKLRGSLTWDSHTGSAWGWAWA